MRRKAKQNLDSKWENARSRTTANLPRASGFCKLQDFNYQTNIHLFSVQLAVELLLLLPHLPYKYHTFSITSAGSAARERFSAFKPVESQHCAEQVAQTCRPAKGHLQTDCSAFSDSSALEDSLFFNPCTISPVVQNITHFDHVIQVTAVTGL